MDPLHPETINRDFSNYQRQEIGFRRYLPQNRGGRGGRIFTSNAYLQRGPQRNELFNINDDGRRQNPFMATMNENIRKYAPFMVGGRGGFLGYGRGRGFPMHFNRGRGAWPQNNEYFRSVRGGRGLPQLSYRKPGNYWRTRVVLDENNWEEALNNLKNSMGAYKVVGFDVECINEKNEEQMRRQPDRPKRIRAQSLSPPPATRRLKKEEFRRSSSSSSSDTEASVHSDMPFLDEEDEEEEMPRESVQEKANVDPPVATRPPLPKPINKKRRPEVSVLMQFATYGGYAVVIRLCFLKNIPQSLRDFLADRSYIKVGVSIDQDAARLREDWDLNLKGWIDLRHLCSEASMRGLIANTGTSKMGLKYMAERVFGSRDIYPPYMNMERMRSLAWSDWNAERLSREQIQYACWDAQIAVDVFALLTQRLFNVRPPSRFDNNQYFDGVAANCKQHMEFPATSAHHDKTSEYDSISGDETPDGLPCSSYTDQNVQVKKTTACTVNVFELLKVKIDHEQKEAESVVTSIQLEDAAIVAVGPVVEEEEPKLPVVFESKDDPAVVLIGPIVRTLSKEKILVHPMTGGISMLMMKNGPNNVLNFEMLVLMTDALKRLEDDPNCRGVIITARRATSKCFSIGYDFSELITELGNRDRLRIYLSVFFELLSVLINSRLITVAAITGLTATAGSVMAAFCDRRFISTSGGMAFNELKLGFALPPCIIDRLIHLMGFHKTEWALTSASYIFAQEAKQCGLVDRVLPDDADVLTAAIADIQEFGNNRSFLPETYKAIFNRDVISKLARERENILDQMTDEILSPKTQAILRKLGGKKYA